MLNKSEHTNFRLRAEIKIKIQDDGYEIDALEEQPARSFLEDPNLLKLRSLDCSSPFFLSDNSIWGQWTLMLQIL